MSPVSTPTAPVTATRQRASVVRDPLHDENLRLAGRAQQLRTALESAAGENLELHRELARAHAQNQHLRSLRTPSSGGCAEADRADRAERVRVMLADPCSCNP
jgi:hypothetical protein